MPRTTTIEIDLPEPVADRLAALARRTQRSAGELAADAITALLDDEAGQVEAIARSVAKADAGGPFVSHTDMKVYLQGLASGERPPRPRTFIDRSE